MMKAYRILGVIGAILLPGAAIAALDIPNVFSEGDVISSSEMNQNFTAVKTSVDALEDRIAVLEAHLAATQGPANWVSVENDLLNDWRKWSSAFVDTGYTKNAAGVVHLRGLIRGGTDTDAFQLPVGYRPSATLDMVGPSDTGGARVRVTTAGMVVIYTDVPVSSDFFVGLGGISFLAEQ